MEVVSLEAMASIAILFVFVNRYLLGVFLWKVRCMLFPQKYSAELPTVAVLMPCYNEGKTVYDSLRALAEVNYPPELFSVVVIDDNSCDDTRDWLARAARELPNITVLCSKVNRGKRLNLLLAVRRVTAEIVVSVDSDTLVDPQAIRLLVRHFTSPRIAAVGGRVYIANADQSWLTRMQAVKFYVAYELFKCLERAFHSVLCLSGCLTAYRRSVLLELEPLLVDRRLLSMPIKYGEDRYLTRRIVQAGYKSVMDQEAYCRTRAPATLPGYMSQQLRWRRSNLADLFVAIGGYWRTSPWVAIHSIQVSVLLLIYPVLMVQMLLSWHIGLTLMVHAGVVSLISGWYLTRLKSIPANCRVNPVWFLAMVVVFPIMYLVLSPLALFTLDSGSWETRKVSGVPGAVKMAETMTGGSDD